MNNPHPLGTVIGGSLGEGLSVRIHPTVDSQQLKSGSFVAINSGDLQFFSLVTDLQLTTSHPDVTLFPPSSEEKLLTKIITRNDVYITATIRPMVCVDMQGRIMPVKTIPRHFSPVLPATRRDVARVFGSESDTTHPRLAIGTPPDMHDADVCLDLDRLCERSSGIFGKTGTGKTFLTRLVLAGVIHRDVASVLIFDTHGEYGTQARTEGSGSFVKGLKTLFPSRVAVFSLDPVSTRRRGSAPDVTLSIPYQSITVDDVIGLQEELNLHATACEAAYLIAARHKEQWLEVLLSRGESLKELAHDVGAHPESLGALYRKLKQLTRCGFLTNSADTHDGVEQMLEYLERGMSIVVEFGSYTSTLAYLLVANIITRRLHSVYIEKTERYLGAPHANRPPKKLLVVIEEAHKFLNPVAARQTIFGTIAREMRKYFVSLLVVDQRPSGIDPEILSQVGTKLVAQLSDEKDIAAVLVGASGASQLRTVLTSLESTKQVLVLGHAATMPIVIQARAYDEQFYKTVTFTTQPLDERVKELF